MDQPDLDFIRQDFAKDCASGIIEYRTTLVEAYAAGLQRDAHTLQTNFDILPLGCVPKASSAAAPTVQRRRIENYSAHGADSINQAIAARPVMQQAGVVHTLEELHHLRQELGPGQDRHR
jgi:hypothetical protein